NDPSLQLVTYLSPEHTTLRTRTFTSFTTQGSLLQALCRRDDKSLFRHLSESTAPIRCSQPHSIPTDGFGCPSRFKHFRLKLPGATGWSRYCLRRLFYVSIWIRSKARPGRKFTRAQSVGKKEREPIAGQPVSNLPVLYDSPPR